MTGLRLEDVEPLAAALGVDGLDRRVRERLFESTGGHTLYLQTVLGDRESWDRPEDGQVTVPASLAFAIGDQLAVLPEETRSLLQMLAVVNARLPLALLGEAAAVTSPSAVIEPAVKAGLVEWSPHEPTAPVSIRHALQRDAIYAVLSSLEKDESCTLER